MPSSGSADRGAQAFTFPLHDQASVSQLSFPNSPARGMVWNVHRWSPVLAWNAWMSPGTFSTRVCPPPPGWAEFPTMITSFTTIGGDDVVIAPTSRSIPENNVVGMAEGTAYPDPLHNGLH